MGVTYNYGAGPTYTKIASQTLGSAAASVTFSNLPQNYTDLVIIMQHKVSGSATAADGFIRVNSDTGSNYSNTQLDSGPGSGRQSNVSFWMWGADVSTEFAITRFDLMNYSNNTTYKSILWRQGLSTVIFANVGLWRSTAAITSISFTSSDQLGQGTADNFTSGSTFTLYGVAAALKPKATGGTVTFDPATSKWIHTFTSSGVFTPTQSITADYLVVAGGGGSNIGGGGAGGLRSTVTATGGGGSLESALSLTKGTSYTVTVGAGGAQLNNGSNSVFSTITSTGGGAGGANSTNGNSGGSGGGGGYGSPNSGGAASPSGQGNAGGNGSTTSGGGGGGAGAVGSNSSGATGAAGGNGVAIAISGSSVTYGGGGGGAGSSSGGAAGSGGGGAGAYTSGGNGTANTGGGGGGGWSVAAAAGGSGIVIVRYSA